MKGSFRGNKNNFLYNYFFKIKNIKHAFGFGWNRFFRRSGSGFLSLDPDPSKNKPMRSK